MAFFKSFQHNLPSVNISSILDSVTSRVDDLANAVSDVTYAVSDQLTEQVTTIINKVQDEEDGENTGSQESGQTSTVQEGKASSKSMWQMTRDSETSNTASKTNLGGDATEAENAQSQLEWEWRDGCWRVKKTDAELAEEERRKQEEKELQAKKEQRRRERRQKQLEKEAEAQKLKEKSQDAEREEEVDKSGQDRRASVGGDQSTSQQRADDCQDPPLSPAPETQSSLSNQEKHKEEGEEAEVTEDSPEREGAVEEEAELSRSFSKGKKKKSDKKKGKEAKGGSKKTEDVEKKKEKGKKNKKKKKGNQG